MFSRFFIDRPILASVPSIMITLVGLAAVFMLPVSQYPEVTPPTVRVSCTYPGASAQVVADTVAAPIEQQVNGVEDMLYMSSQSSNDGTYQLTVTFKVGTNLNMAQVLVQNRVNLAMPGLPDVVKQVGVTTIKRSPDLMLFVNLISPDGRYDQLYLSNYATIQVRDELARLEGVGEVFIFGQRDYSMRVWLDPDCLSSRGITASDVVRALREQNVQVAAGQIGQQPAARGVDFQYTMSTLGRLTEPEQFGEIVVKTGGQGQITRLRDLGRIELGAKNQDVRNYLDGSPSAGVGVFQLPGANALETADRVKAKMQELKERLSRGARLPHRLRHHALHPRVDRRGLQDAPRCRAAGGPGGPGVPAELALGGHSPGRRAGGDHRHLRRHGRDGFGPEHPLLVRPGPGHRDRRGRRDRGRRGHRAPHRRGHGPPGRRAPGHVRGLGPGDRHRAGAVVRVHSLRVPVGDHGAVLPAVRHDDRRLHDPLDDQLADPQPGPLRHPAQGAPRPPRSPLAGPQLLAGLVLRAV